MNKRSRYVPKEYGPFDDKKFQMSTLLRVKEEIGEGMNSTKFLSLERNENNNSSYDDYYKHSQYHRYNKV